MPDNNELARELRVAAKVNRASDPALARLLIRAADALHPRPPCACGARGYVCPTYNTLGYCEAEA